MASHNELGQKAEELAINYLTSHGYQILHRNWRFSHYEIDIIAMKMGLLRIVEVKALRTSEVRYPEESVTRKKFRHIRKAADEFLFQNQQHRNIQFDVLAITIHPANGPDYFLIEDVFL